MWARGDWTLWLQRWPSLATEAEYSEEFTVWSRGNCKKWHGVECFGCSDPNWFRWTQSNNSNCRKRCEWPSGLDLGSFDPDESDAKTYYCPKHFGSDQFLPWNGRQARVPGHVESTGDFGLGIWRSSTDNWASGSRHRRSTIVGECSQNQWNRGRITLDQIDEISPEWKGQDLSSFSLAI